MPHIYIFFGVLHQSVAVIVRLLEVVMQVDFIINIANEAKHWDLVLFILLILKT